MLLASNSSETINFQSSGSLSATDVSKESALMNAFPNPFQDQLSIDFETVTNKIVEIQVIDMTGKVVLQEPVDFGTKGLQLNTAHLLSGIYVLRVKDRQ
jgi:hypothetical protein